jgi:phosphatidylglycerol lysyltransferase
VACDADKRLLGVTSWMPSFRNGHVTGWTLDFMRRATDSMNGVMEFLIAAAATRFREQGAEVMSLSTAPLASTLPSPGAAVTTTERFLARVGTAIEPAYGFRSLFEFKKKFQPELHPIYLAYPDALALPAIGVALVRAYLPMLSVRYVAALVFGHLASRKPWGRRSVPSGSRTSETSTTNPASTSSSAMRAGGNS